ncbi:MAG: relaxase domain-containing protein [Microthrixaceae bacterium]|nr:relaxase domain-containing protein [Microthrixaceae bacterium]
MPLVEGDGSRWVRASELARCSHARDSGVDPGEIRSLGAPDDQLSLAEAARLVGLTKQYLRSLARYHDEHQVEIERSLAAGRHPRRAFLVAQRGTKGRWLVTREHLAEFVERRRPPAVRVGYDLTLTTEKSLGVLALLGDTTTRTAVLGSIQTGNDWALGWLEDHAAVGRVDGKPVNGEGWMVASFRHLTSRALDPFPHHHNVIANTVRLSDGTNRALDARALYRHAQAASALATAEMRHQLTNDLGVRWRPGRKSGWEIDGITSQVVGEFSKRRNEIDDALRELEEEIGRGAHPGEVEHIVLRTRPAKNHTPADDLIASWRGRAARHGLTTEALAAVSGNKPQAQDVDEAPLFASLAEAEGICSGGSVFSRSEALVAMANHPVPTTEGDPSQPLLCGASRLIELTDQFLAPEQVVALTDADELLYSTVEMLGVQDRIATRFTRGLTPGRAPSEATSAGSSERTRTSPRTAAACHGVVPTRASLPGRHRTPGLARPQPSRLRDAWTAAGYRVLGAAVKGEATRTLAAATGIECETVAWYLVHTDPQSLPLDSRTILVVDEASTLSDRDLDTLMEMAATTGASLRLIGDPAQHGAIAAGHVPSALRAPRTRHTRADDHAPPPETPTTVRRALRGSDRRSVRSQLAAAGHLHMVADDRLSTARCSAAGGTPTAKASTTRWSIDATAPAANSTASPTSYDA